MDIDTNKGEMALRNHLIKLMYDGKISVALCSLLHNMFSFDPRKRAKCDDILKHSWFQQYTNV